MMMQFTVRFGDDQNDVRIIQVSDRADIEIKAREKFVNKTKDCDVTVKYFMADFDAWINLDEVDEVKNKGKLKLVPVGLVQKTGKVAEDSADANLLGNDCQTDDGVEPCCAGISVSTDSDTDFERFSSGVGSSSSGFVDDLDITPSADASSDQAAKSLCAAKSDDNNSDSTSDDGNLAESSLASSSRPIECQDDLTERPEWPGANYKIVLSERIVEVLKGYASRTTPGGESVPIEDAVQKDITTELFNDLWRYRGPYPGSLAYNQACAALVRGYPILADRSLPSDRRTSHIGYASWKTRLRSKFGEMRRINRDECERIAECKKKYGRRRKVVVQDDESDVTVITSPRRKVTIPHFSPNWMTGNTEDRHSLDDHVATIQTYWKRRKRDSTAEVTLDDRFSRSFYDRHQKALTGMSTEEILGMYPLLIDAHWVLKEMELIWSANRWNSKDTRRFGVDILTRIRTRSACNADREIDFKKIPDDIDSLRVMNDLDWKIGIPTIFGESYQNFLLVDKTPEPKQSTPIMAYDTRKSAWKVHFDGIAIENVRNFHQALAVMISLHWVFHVQFSPYVKRSMTFLSVVIGMIPDSSVEVNNTMRNLNNRLKWVVHDDVEL